MTLNAPDHAVDALIPRQRRPGRRSAWEPAPVPTVDPALCGCELVTVPALGTFFARRSCPSCGCPWLFLRENSCGRGTWGRQETTGG